MNNMIKKIYYDPLSGLIVATSSGNFITLSDKPYIQTNQNIDFTKYKVNLETLELEQITP
jgi:hypothetical protein